LPHEAPRSALVNHFLSALFLLLVADVCVLAQAPCPHSHELAAPKHPYFS
jgi:hypothetical protein